MLIGSKSRLSALVVLESSASPCLLLVECQKKQPSKKLTLAAAAEALVEAASLEADSMTQKQLAQNLDSLKASFDSNLNRAVQSVKSSNENFDAKMNTLNQHVMNEIGALKDEITAVKMLLEEEKKQKTLDRALKLAYHGSFTYYPHSYRVQEESGKLAEGVIGWFLLGEGAFLPSDATLVQSQTQYTTKEQREKEDASKKAFRAKFIEQIKRLIKREPRVEKKMMAASSFTIPKLCRVSKTASVSTKVCCRE